MAITYSDDLSTDRARVRFHLQDTTDGGGPKPGDGNFTDNEVDGLIDAAGSWQRAVAAGLRALAMAWRRYPDFKADGLALSRSDIADGYEGAAAAWEKRFGIPTPVVVAGVIKVDGYSDDITSDDVDTDTEYGPDFKYVTPK